MKRKLLSALLAVIICLMSLTLVSAESDTIQYTSADITSESKSQYPEKIKELKANIERIMKEGFTYDEAHRIYALSLALNTSKTEDEIKQMFKEGKSLDYIYKNTLNGVARTPRKVLTNEQILDLCNKGYYYCQIKYAQEMYFNRRYPSFEKALEAVVQDPPDEVKYNAKFQDLMIKVLKGEVILNSVKLDCRPDEFLNDKERVKAAKAEYDRLNGKK